MKCFTLLLATFILFLAAKPGIDFPSLEADTARICCSSQCTPISDCDNTQDQNENNDCDGKSCNPFQVCNSCVLVCLHISLIRIPIPTIFLDNGITHQSDYISPFTPDFWQPPKIV